MNTSMRWIASVILFTVACDSKSNEIGATVGDEESTNDSVDVDESSAGDTEEESDLGPCAEAVTQDACEALDFGLDAEEQCAWISEIYTSDNTCSLDTSPIGRCITMQYFGDGCVSSPCVGDENVYRRDRGDGTFEWFASSVCGSEPVGFSQCLYDGANEVEPGCGCVCEGLGGGVPGVECDPLGDACPDTSTVSQECEPNATGESWSCFPQNAGTSPSYGDECWPEDSPSVACTGQNICLDADGLGVAGCDGGEGGGCCTMLCDLFDDFNPCPDEGQVCAPFYADDVPEGYEHVGICRLPSS